MKLSDQEAAFAHDVSNLINNIFTQGYKCTLGEAFRTPEQAAIYAKEGKGIKDSLHCDRLAIDLNLFSSDGTYLTDAKSYEKFGTFWESLNPHNRWGGYFVSKYGGKLVDLDHFERKPE